MQRKTLSEYCRGMEALARKIGTEFSLPRAFAVRKRLAETKMPQLRGVFQTAGRRGRA